MSTLKRFVRQILILSVLLLFPRESWTLCAYRGIMNLPPKAFSYWGNWGCYIYIRPDLFHGYPLMASSCKIDVDTKEFDVPGLTFNDSCVPFDFSNERIKDAVKNTLKHASTLDKWVECSLKAQECCNKVMKDSVPEENHCPAVWDAWSCFESIPAGETYKQVCSRYAYAAQPPRCHHFSYKECYGNGTWRDRTDYSGCDVTPRLKVRQNWHISTLAISIFFCTPAALVLIVLDSQKLSIIRNLVFSIIIRNLFVILVKSIIIMDELTNAQNTVMSQNKWPCKLLSFFEKLSGNAVFACMLLEGFYLHQLLTNAFRTRQSEGVKMMPFYLGCGILAVGSAVAWAGIMASHYDENCWQVTEGTDFSWILSAPRLLMLVINLALLSHIVWTLWNAFRSKDGEQHPAMRTVKAAVICFPLFGIPFFFVIIHPDTDSCGAEQFYYFVNYSIEALQAIFIVIFHCYKERDIKKTFVTFFDLLRDYWKKKRGKQDSFGDSIPSERRVTGRSNLENTENRTPRSTNVSQERPTGILSKFEVASKEERLVRFEEFSRVNNEARNVHITMSSSNENHNINDGSIQVENEITLDPKILFKNRSEDIVLLNPEERKY